MQNILIDKLELAFFLRQSGLLILDEVVVLCRGGSFGDDDLRFELVNESFQSLLPSSDLIYQSRVKYVFEVVFFRLFHGFVDLTRKLVNLASVGLDQRFCVLTTIRPEK